MGCSRLRTCCCCGTLQGGSLVTGVLGIVLSVATVLFIWLYPMRYNIIDGQEENWLGISNFVMKIILTVNLLMTIFISALMMVGALKHKTWCMLPWVVLGAVLSVGLLVSVLHTSIQLYLHDDDKVPDEQRVNGTSAHDGDKYPMKHDYTMAATIILVGGIIYFCVFVYLWWVVFSHFLNVKDEEERGRYMKPPYRR